MEQLAPEFLGQPLRKTDGRLAAEEPGIGLGKHVVEVGVQLAKLVRVGIPIAQQRQGKEVAQQERVAVGSGAVNEVYQRHARHYEGAAFEQSLRVGYLVLIVKDEHRGKERVNQRNQLYA